MPATPNPRNQPPPEPRRCRVRVLRRRTHQERRFRHRQHSRHTQAQLRTLRPNCCNLGRTRRNTVLLQSAAAEDDHRVGADNESSRYLEDPDIIGGARKRDIRWDRKAGGPFVDGRVEGHPANVPCAQLGKISRPPGAVGVRGFHVAYGRRQVHRRRRCVVGCKYVSDHQRRCRKFTRGIQDQPGRSDWDWLGRRTEWQQEGRTPELPIKPSACTS